MSTGASGSRAVVGTGSTGALPISVWPTLAGVATAAGVLVVGDFAAVVLVCAAIYLLAAVTRRPWSAWVGFAASIPLVGIGRLLDAPWLAIAIVATTAIALVALGAVRGAWRRRENARQLPAMLGFGALGILAASLGDPLAVAVLIVVALLAHAAWDIWHHATGTVVARPYAEFCAALDIALALAVALVAGFGAMTP